MGQFSSIIVLFYIRITNFVGLSASGPDEKLRGPDVARGPQAEHRCCSPILKARSHATPPPRNEEREIGRSGHTATEKRETRNGSVDQ